jgi:hypothetical protein
MKALLNTVIQLISALSMGNHHLTSKPDFLMQIHGFTPKTSPQSRKNKEISRFKNTHRKEVLLKSVETWCAWSRSALAHAKSIGETGIMF